VVVVVARFVMQWLRIEKTASKFGVGLKTYRVSSSE
jgi:hypothetical protein